MTSLVGSGTPTIGWAALMLQQQQSTQTQGNCKFIHFGEQEGQKTFPTNVDRNCFKLLSKFNSLARFTRELGWDAARCFVVAQSPPAADISQVKPTDKPKTFFCHELKKLDIKWHQVWGDGRGQMATWYLNVFNFYVKRVRISINKLSLGPIYIGNPNLLPNISFDHRSVTEMVEI